MKNYLLLWNICGRNNCSTGIKSLRSLPSSQNLSESQSIFDQRVDDSCKNYTEINLSRFKKQEKVEYNKSSTFLKHTNSINNSVGKFNNNIKINKIRNFEYIEEKYLG